jgi:hypothetical protein
MAAQVAAAMLEFKAKGKAQEDGITTQFHKDRGGFLKDIDAAHQLSLQDAVFTSAGPLSGPRLAALQQVLGFRIKGFRVLGFQDLWGLGFLGI